MRNGLTGAIAHGYSYVLIAICLTVLLQPTSSETLVDYEKNACTRSYEVNDINVYRLQSYPRQGVNSGRDKCFNQFTASNNKKLKIHVYEVKIGSCGIFLKIFDGDPKMLNEPRWSLGCRGAEKTVYESYSSEVIVRLDKPTSDSSSLYSFRVYITNENGPEVDLSAPVMSDGGASSGVIAGIGIGVGLVVVVIIIVVAIVCWRMMGGRKEKYASKSPGVFATSTTRGGDSVHFENTPGGSRRATRASSDRSSTTNGFRSGSQRGRSSQHQDNNGYVSSNDSSVTTKKVSHNPIPIKAGDGAKFVTETEIETTTHRFKKRDGSVRRQISSDHDKETKQSQKKERPKDESDGARVGLIQKSKPNDNSHSLARSTSEKRNTKLRSTVGSRADTSSDTMSSHSDRRSKREDRHRDRSQDDRHRDRSRDDRNDERSKDSATRRSSYRESQSQDHRDRIGSTRIRTNSTSRSTRPSYKDEYDTGGQRHRSGQTQKDTGRHHEQYYSDYDSDHRRREKHDRNRGYDSDTRRRHHDYDSDRGGRDRSQRRYDQSDRNYSDYESDHGRRHDSSRRRRQQTERNYREYDSDDNSHRSSRHRSQRQDHREKYHSDEDLVERRRSGSLSRKSRPRSQSYSRDSRR